MMPTLIYSVYHAGMPKEPLIQNAAKRRLIIAIAMSALLVLSLASAALISGASLGL